MAPKSVQYQFINWSLISSMWDFCPAWKVDQSIVLRCPDLKELNLNIQMKAEVFASFTRFITEVIEILKGLWMFEVLFARAGNTISE